jgi:hypothetical protein
METIRALYDPKNSTIDSVPVDLRLGCKEKLLESLERPKIAGRVSLLCNCGTTGQGKSVILSMNMFWFLECVRGIAVETTFNDDQDGLEGELTVSFECALAIRILHRLVGSVIGKSC